MKWRPGQSGNPAGRTAGYRSEFSDPFFRDVEAVWKEHGRTAIERVAVEDPGVFLRVCASVVPKEVAISVAPELPTSMDSADRIALLGLVSAIRERLPNAGDMKPEFVAEYVSRALEAYEEPLLLEAKTDDI